MRRYWGIGAAWLGATVLSVLIASAAVAGIRDRVVEAPVAIGLPTSTTTSTPPETAAETSLPPSTTSTAVGSISTTSTTTTTLPETTSTSTPAAPAETTSTTTTALPPTTTTTAPPTTTTTTTAPATYSTYDLIGGTVVLAFGSGQVNLVSATPRPGFSVDPEHTGPDEVEVKFVSDDHRSKLEAEVVNGELKVETEEESHGDEDD